MENPLNFSPEEGNLARNVKAAVVYSILFTSTLLKGCLARADNGEKFDPVLKDHVEVLERNEYRDRPPFFTQKVQWLIHTRFTDDAGQEHLIRCSDFLVPQAESIVWDSRRRVWVLTVCDERENTRQITADEYWESKTDFDPWRWSKRKRDYGRGLIDSNTFQ